jgi:dolichyl-phosphate beta-glucosyltransferase
LSLQERSITFILVTHYKPHWTIIVPCHNKGSLLQRTLDGIESVFKQETVRVVVIENGSTDDSRDWLENLQLSNPKHSLIKAEIPKAGLGAAVKAAQRYIDDNEGWAVIAAADSAFGETDLRGFRDAVARNPAPHVFAASKLHQDSQVSRPIGRWFFTSAQCWARRYFFGSEIKDSQGTLCMPTKLLKDLCQIAQSDAFFFLSEVVILAELRGISAKELPVVLSLPEAPSSVHFVRDSVIFFRDLIHLRSRTHAPAQ